MFFVLFGVWENGRKLIWPGQQCRKVGVIGLIFEILMEMKMKADSKGPFLIIFEFDFQIMEAENFEEKLDLP